MKHMLHQHLTEGLHEKNSWICRSGGRRIRSHLCTSARSPPVPVERTAGSNPAGTDVGRSETDAVQPGQSLLWSVLIEEPCSPQPRAVCWNTSLLPRKESVDVFSHLTITSLCHIMEVSWSVESSEELLYLHVYPSSNFWSM